MINWIKMTVNFKEIGLLVKMERTMQLVVIDSDSEMWVEC